MKMITKLMALVLIYFGFFLQSCIKDDDFHNDKLLLYKVTGNFSSANYYGVNSWEYNTDGSFSTQYRYGPRINQREEWRHLTKKNFITAGAWNFSYMLNLPDKTMDNSIPNVDQGYWKFYYNQRGFVEKVGFAPTQNEEPVIFENYTYNQRGLLTTVVKSQGDWGYTTKYFYDNKGKLTHFDYYYSMFNNGSTNRKVETAPVKPGTFGIPGFEKKFMEIRSRLQKSNVASTDYLLFGADVTSDDKINPYSQQARLLFYPAYRSGYMNDFFLCIMRTNPLSVTYTFNPDYYGEATITQTFSYNYNFRKYPVTVHESVSDPANILYGDYTQESRIDYISND